ncbi:GNAT family N-acetyltransferase [Streptomyces sp. NPDC050504]|uniref:GNAT family N-acetyltransferase n=1 Tax=Streptomyces sp. NPDC050504 TaxID=3365618 RepID=UPI0037A6536B
MSLVVRDLVPDDCEAVAELRVSGWRAAYAGLVPRSYLDAMDAAADAARRREFLAGPTAPAVTNVVAEDGTGVVGWAAYGPYREGSERIAGTCELYAIYLRPERVGTGVGRALLADVLERVSGAGFTEVRLWVLRENARARRFYERAGFVFDGAEEPWEVDGTVVPEVRYARGLP